MVALTLSSAEFKPNDKWPLLFVIADIYSNKASPERPLTDTDVVKIAQTEYGLHVERHVVKKYREHLVRCFGFVFARRKKGHYLERMQRIIQTAPAQEKDIQKGIKTYGDGKQRARRENELFRKIEIANLAILEHRTLEIVIPHYLHTRPYKKGEWSISSRKTAFHITPKEVFRYQGEYFLLSYIPSEKAAFFHLIRNIEFGEISIKERVIEENPLTYDLGSYLARQDFLITGPIDFEKDENKYYKGERSFLFYSKWGAIAIQGTKKDIENPFILQSVIDLYGEALVRWGQQKWEGGKCPSIYGISFPDDIKAEAIYLRLKQPNYVDADSGW